MLTLYRRHKSQCPFKNNPVHRGCSCAVWCRGSLEGQQIRRALKTVSWERGQKLIAEWTNAGVVVEPKAEITVDYAIREYLLEAESNGRAAATLHNLTRWTTRFSVWCQANNVKRLVEVDNQIIRQWEAHKSHLKVSSKRLGRVQLRAWFVYCRDRGWMTGDPTRGLGNLKREMPSAEPYEIDDVVKLLAEVDQPDLMALLQLLLHSGLRILDAITLKRDKIDAHGNLALKTNKTGHSVRLPLHPDALAALRALPATNGYFFMAPGERPDSVRERHRSTMQAAWTKAGCQGRCYFHRFRHTFACTLLGKGVPIDQLSKLLGHSSVTTTEKHYSQWVQARQALLDASVRQSWG
jgi:integrase/recombinase XerD